MEPGLKLRSRVQRGNFIYMSVRRRYVRPQLSFIQQARQSGRIGSYIILQGNEYSFRPVLINVIFDRLEKMKTSG